ncbi:sensor histidine kinase [Paenibacillus sp. J5C2022]|uniref:cache domain-containing sensor histidine kinase n=1 Tax=Paenibacillus sp. J5C2022 TaxID=2977129 RepID=UPI0021CE4714|nr:histidine kinase [Paenibacillus sp. J5C2022]
MLTLIPLLIISSTFYLRSKEVIEKGIVQSRTVNQLVAETGEKIDRLLLQHEQKMKDIINNASVVRLLHNDLMPERYPLDTEERAFVETIVEELLALEYENMRENIGDLVDAIVLFNKQGDVYSPDPSWTIEFRSALELMPYEREGEPAWAFFLDKGRIIGAVKRFGGGENVELGMLAVTLNEDKVQKLFSEFPSHFQIVTKSNIILSSNEPDKLGKLYRREENPNKIEHAYQSSVSEYRYIGLEERGLAIQQIDRQAWFSISITIGAWILVMVITFFILRRITRPILTLSRLMELAKKENYQLIENIHTVDEIGILAQSYNKLISRTKHLIETVYMSEIKQKESELKAIRIHFNPHFLYNTLEYVSILAQQNRSREIPSIVHKLSRIFRFSISSDEPFVSLELELVFSEIYLQIHKHRYENRLNYSIEIAEELKSLLIPKLILQPVIENAFIHGIDHLPDNGEISIKVYEKEYRLYVDITNNGPNPEEIESVQSAGTGTGLANVRSRIRLHFGEEYGLELLRNDKRLTVARICLPIMFPNN